MSTTDLAPRYVVGIDLGTTNSAVSYVDTAERPWRVRTFPVPQLVAPGVVEAREILPSFLYQPAKAEFSGDALRLPWERGQRSGDRGQGSGKKGGGRREAEYVVGFFARDQGAVVPGRLIASAKSWLCHSGVDRTADLLPWHGAPDVERLSPIEASARYLKHMADAWDARFPHHPMSQQDIVLTLPASFDEVARELTVKAAARAGLPRVVLIEEPQAAFYAWLYAHADDWERQVTPGQKILVCDIGGGTSDFTLIRVRRAGEAGKVQFHRVAVGEHLILGGDNLDLALAHHIERRLAGTGSSSGSETEREAAPGTGGQATSATPSLQPSPPGGWGTGLPSAEPPSPQPSPGGRGGQVDPREWAVLVRTCRQVKETLLGENAPERLTINLPGAGARLIGGARQIDVTREEVQRVLLDGFFPYVGLEEKPLRRQSGFQEFGLPYAPDPAITRSLAAFLTAHRHVAVEDEEAAGDHDPARPDIVLLGGGLFASPVLRERLLEVLRGWFRGEGDSAGGLLSSRPPSAQPSARESVRGGGDRSSAELPSPRPPSPRPSPGGRGGETWAPLVLDNERLDLAVARGAAYYGMVRRGEGVRIAAGLARTYYIGVEGEEGGVETAATDVTKASLPSPPVPAEPPSPEPTPKEIGGLAVCLVPAGVEPGQDVDLAQRRFTLLVCEPVEFPLYVSSTRLTDKPGELVPIDRERMTPLPPIRTVLRTRRKSEVGTVSVTLHARLTEIGTLDLWCSEIAARRSWRLQFDVRSATRTDLAAHGASGIDAAQPRDGRQAESEGVVDEATWQECATLIRGTFGPEGKDKPAGLVKRLAGAIGTGRDRWPASLLRRIWEALMELEPGRRRSQVHEARWLNLLGFALRPGYGLAVDDWRVAQTWNTVQGKLAHPGPLCQVEGWILWRRIGGGLAAGQQQAVAEPLLAPVRGLHRQLTTGKRRGGDFAFTVPETAEVWRLLGSLELLGVAAKIELGRILLDVLPKRKMDPVRPAIAWSLGRIGARVPVYGPLNTVVPVEVVSDWLAKLMKLYPDDPMARLAVMQMARRTDDRYRELPEKLRGKVLEWLRLGEAPAHFVELVRDGGQLDSEEQGLIFGEALPKGLRMM
jgi:hypothetical protein